MVTSFNSRLHVISSVCVHSRSWQRHFHGSHQSITAFLSTWTPRQAQLVRVLSVDLSKAFDVITHSSTINACCRFKIPFEVYPWIASNLKDRRQRVKIGESFSNWTNVTSGVPQGSVLGPLLFCIVTNDLSPVHANSTIIQYADDISLLHFVINATQDRLPEEFRNMVSWAENLKLCVNYYDKCYLMDVVTKKGLTLLPLPHVTPVTHLKLLGLTLSNDKRWTEHVNSTIKKASRRIFLMLNLSRAACPPHIIFKAYCTYVRSVLLYSFPAFCNIPVYLKSKMIRVEKRVFRLLGQHTFPSLFAAGDEICRRAFKEVVMHADHPLRRFFTLRQSFGTRSRGILQPPRTKTSRFKNSFLRFSC